MKKLAGLLGLTALFAMPLCSCTVGDATGEGDNQTATDLKSVAQGIIGNVIGKAASKVTFASISDYEEVELDTPYKFKNSEVTFYGVMMEFEDDFEDVCDDLKSYVKGYKKTSDGQGEDDGYMDLVYKKDGIGVALYAAEDYGMCSVDVFDYKHYDAYCDVVYGEEGGGDDDYEYEEAATWSQIPFSSVLTSSITIPGPQGASNFYYAALEDEYGPYLEIFCEGEFEDSYKDTLAAAGWDVDDSLYDYAGYFADSPDGEVEIQFYDYEGEFVAFIYDAE